MIDRATLDAAMRRFPRSLRVLADADAATRRQWLVESGLDDAIRLEYRLVLAERGRGAP